MGEQLKILDSGNYGWIVGRDFNIVRSNEEKLGGLYSFSMGITEFNTFIHAAALIDIPSDGPKLSWCNGQEGTRRIWARLDRIMVNQHFKDQFPVTQLS